MAEQLTPVAVGIQSDSSGFKKGFEEAARTAETQTGKINTALGKMSNSFKSASGFASGFASEIGGNTLNQLAQFAKGGAAMGAVVAATGVGIAAFTRHAMTTADNMGDMATNLGITTDALQELNYVAMLGGVSQEGFSNALNKLNLNLGNARDGTGSLVEFLKDYDRTLLANLQNTTDASVAFGILSDAVAKETDATKRRQIVTAAFGKGELNLINTLIQGSAAIDEQRRKAQELGLVIENSLIVNAGTANDQLDTLGRVIMTKLTAEVVKLAPAIGELAQRLTDGLPTLISWVDAFAQFMGLVGAGPDERLKEVNKEIASLNELLTKNETLQKAMSLGGLLGDFDHDNMQKRLEELRKERDKIIGDMQSAANKPTTKPSTTGTGGGGTAFVKSEADAAAKAMEKTNEQRKRLMEDIENERNGLVRLESAQSISVKAYEKMIVTLQAEQQVRAAGIDVMSAEGQAMVEQIENNAEAQKVLQDELDRTKKRMEEVANFSKQVGDRISDAFYDATMSGKSFRETLSALLQDMAKMVYQQTAGNAISSLISSAMMGAMTGGFGGGAGAASAGAGLSGFSTQLTSSFGFANGGIMTGSGPLALNAYSSGGVANSPQLALFGEGRKPEAYVPLPDGRTIPVTMSGGGGNNFSFQIDARGADGTTEERLKLAVSHAVSLAMKNMDDAKRRNPNGLR